jgi:hypothetical protein
LRRYILEYMSEYQSPELPSGPVDTEEMWMVAQQKLKLATIKELLGIQVPGFDGVWLYPTETTFASWRLRAQAGNSRSAAQVTKAGGVLIHTESCV